jgi:GT2 family glycosyltransferase
VLEAGSISVIVPVYNASATLRRCLLALAQQSHAPLELILVDNVSSDGSYEEMQVLSRDFPYPVRITQERHQGAAAARNAGARLAAGEWLAFTDADCEPEPEWLATGVALSGESDAEVVALAGPAWGTLEGDATARMLGLTSLSVGLDEHVCSDAGPTGTQGFAAANLWVRRQALLDIDGFDESLTVAGEDMDLCARLYAAGGLLRYAPQLRVRHIHPSGVAHMWRKQVQYGRAHAGLFRRYGRPGIHLDLPWLGQWHIPCRCFVWCNLTSAEKKLLLLILLGIWQPWLWLLVAGYLASVGYSLRRRAAGLGNACGMIDSLGLALLFVVKSAAVTWGRVRGSDKGAFTC